MYLLARGYSIELAKIVNGKYPSQTSLNYIWANKKSVEYNHKSLQQPFHDDTCGKRAGAGGKLGKIHIIKDYIAAFGKSPPVMATIAVMSDADNTGESARAYRLP